MLIRDIHPWNLPPKEAVSLQKELRAHLVFKPMPRMPRLIAGADVSYDKGSDIFHAAIVVLSLPDLEMLEEVSASGRVDFPYIPGLLSFREGPIVLEAFKKLESTPDLVIFDGQGIAHPRGIGIASHIGLFLGVPTIGCAKTRLVGEYAEPGPEKGDFSALFKDGTEIGSVVRTKRRVKPLFVSPGHLITMEESLDIVLKCSSRYRLPEPTRRAHLLSNRVRRESQTS
jgi:deoxyribonuclease V